SNGSFTQVNLPANRLLIQEVGRLSGIQRQDQVIELYCGAGNLSLSLAAQAKDLIGIEQDPSAVADAEANAARAGLTNARFVCATVYTGVQRLFQQGTSGDVIVLDPPRTGAADVIAVLPRFKARTVVYVSCDPTTLARDLRRLLAQGYQLSAL